MPDRPLAVTAVAALLIPCVIVIYLLVPTGGILIASALLMGLAYFVSRHELGSYLYRILAFSLPFSLETLARGESKLFFPSELLAVLALMVFFSDLILFRKYIKVRQHKRELWLILPIVAALPVSLAFSSMPQVSLKASMVAITYIIVFLLAPLLRAEDWRLQIKKLIDLYTLGFLMLILYAFWRYADLGFNPKTIKGVFEPFYSDHTITGAVAAMLSCWYLGRALIASSIRKALHPAWLSILLMAVVVFSSSRAALWSLLVAMAIALMLRAGMRIKVFAVLALLLVTIAWFSRYRIADELAHIRYDSGDSRISMVEQAKSVGNVSTDVSNLERLNRWYAGLRMWQQRPVAGYGPGTFQFQYIPFQNERFMNRLSVTDPWHIPENSGGSAHSEYVLALSEGGSIGLFALLILWAGVFARGIRLGWGSSLPAMLALSTYFFHAFFNNFMTTDKVAFLFYMMAAMVLIASQKGRDEQKRLL